MHGTAFLSASQMVPAVLFLRGGGWQGASFHRGYKQKRLDSFSFPDTHTFVDTRNSYNIFCLIMFSIRANLLLLTEIVQLLEVGGRQEPGVLDCLSRDCPALQTHTSQLPLRSVKDREEGGPQTVGTSVHSQASFSTSNLSRVGPPQQSVFLVRVTSLNF